MNLEQAKQQATQMVYVHMTRGSIEGHCKARNIQVTKNRTKMELSLIEALTKELMNTRTEASHETQ